MRRVVVLVVLGLLLVAGGWLVLGGGAPPAVEDARAVARTPVEEVARERAGDGPAAQERASKPATSKRKTSKQDREVMRRRIVEAMEARERSSAGDGERAPGEDGGGASAPSRRSAAAEPPDEAEPQPGNLTDRTGNHGYLMKVMNEDLMPLADECYALARETQPELAGMLVIDVEIIGDEEIGGVIETAAPGQSNELTDPGLIECVRESLLSTTLPPPPEGGKDAISLSLRLEPDEG